MSRPRRHAAVHRHRSVRTGAFTLVELLLVVVLLAILGAVALPHALSERGESVASALRASVAQVGMVLSYQHQKQGDGTWPAAIDGDWFLGGMLPQHPDRLAGVPQVETVCVPGKQHPDDRVLGPGSPGAYWYNAAEGIFRARVKDQGSSEATLELYEQVNLCGAVSSGSSGGSGGTPGNLSTASVGSGSGSRTR